MFQSPGVHYTRGGAPVGKKLSRLSWFSIAGPSRICIYGLGGKKGGVVFVRLNFPTPPFPSFTLKKIKETPSLSHLRGHLL